MWLTLALHASLLAGALPATEAVPPSTVVHLGISLRLTHQDELEALRRAQLDPASPAFRRWLTPEEFGARFGQPPATYAQLREWLQGAGLSVTTAPNLVFIEALGTAEQVERLLQVQLEPVEGESFSVHTLQGRPLLPEWLAPLVLNISGLDTRVRYRHHLAMPNGVNSFGPQDLRRFYGAQPLLDQGFIGQGQKTVVLSTATPPGAGPSAVNINYYFQNVANARAVYQQRVLANSQGDFDRQQGANVEFELDVQMHAVGVPGADSITLLVSPASEVFTTGANDIVNHLSDTTAVSVSLGLCEPGEKQNQQVSGFNLMAALQQTVIQGGVEGQTWSAATGDNGADDCRNHQTVSADFPASIPEMVAAGGSQLAGAQWNSSHAMPGYQQEQTWNAGQNGGAAGGGFSIVFARPTYQQGLGQAGTGRILPDLALMSGGPAVAVDAVSPGSLSQVTGTSVASPMSAGFFALIASRLGCRLGDPHAALYALGQAQFDGGAAVFHDLTTGNLTFAGVPGPAAGPGYDPATGWGSLNVAALAAAWPPCALADGGTIDPPDAGAPYVACEFAPGCDAGTACVTLPGGGPSTCTGLCNAANPAGCPSGFVCSNQTLFSSGNTGSCIPGCLSTTDCASQPGTVCLTCNRVCIAAGSATAKIGAACTASVQCPSGAYCSTSRTFTGGYCTQDCQPASTGACSCPAGTKCATVGRFNASSVCLATCSDVGQACGDRTGYLCQPQNAGAPVCLPACTVTVRNGMTFDSCASIGTSLACDVPSGVCGGRPDAGSDAGGVDAGEADAGQDLDAGQEPPDAGAPVELPVLNAELGAPAGGCGCSTGSGSLAAALLLLAASRSRLRARSPR